MLMGPIDRGVHRDVPVEVTDRVGLDDQAVWILSPGAVRAERVSSRSWRASPPALFRAAPWPLVYRITGGHCWERGRRCRGELLATKLCVNAGPNLLEHPRPTDADNQRSKDHDEHRDHDPVATSNQQRNIPRR